MTLMMAVDQWPCNNSLHNCEALSSAIGTIIRTPSVKNKKGEDSSVLHLFTTGNITRQSISSWAALLI